MLTVKSKDDSRAKHNAISACLSDYSGFNPRATKGWVVATHPLRFSASSDWFKWK